MKKIFKDYEEKLMNGLNPINDLDNIKSKLSFKTNENVYKKTPKQKMLFAGLSFLLVCIIGVVLSVVIVNYVNTPVYEKMEIVETNANRLSGKRLSGTKHHHDHNINQDDCDEYIENEAPDVIIDESVKYFAEKNSEIIVAIHISNPKQFEILSFTLNDYKYQSYEFQDGSTGSIIYVKVKVGDVSGIETFYINEIKYVDGTQIKNARYEGDRTLNIGVTYQYPPTTEVISENITNHSFEMVFRADDKDNLIKEDTFYKAYLFDESGLVSTKTLTTGLQEFTVHNLKLNTYYQLIICASVDLLDSEGIKTIYMYNEVFKTTAGIINPTVETTENEVKATFDTINDTIKIKSSSVYLVDSDEPLKTVESSEVIISDIYSNTEYVLYVTYEYELDGEVYTDTWISTEHYEGTIKTKEYAVPTLDFTLTPTKDTVTVDYIIGDEHNLGSISKVEIYLGDTLQELTLENNVVGNLLSNNVYTFVITYTYDLNDQTGPHEFIVEHDVTTESYTTPTFSGNAIYASVAKFLQLDFVMNDIDSIGTITNVSVYYNDTLIKDNLTLDGFVNNIDPSYEELTVVIEFSYDLHDGDGIHNDKYTHVVRKG